MLEYLFKMFRISSSSQQQVVTFRSHEIYVYLPGGGGVGGLGGTAVTGGRVPQSYNKFAC